MRLVLWQLTFHRMYFRSMKINRIITEIIIGTTKVMSSKSTSLSSSQMICFLWVEDLGTFGGGAAVVCFCCTFCLLGVFGVDVADDLLGTFLTLPCAILKRILQKKSNLLSTYLKRVQFNFKRVVFQSPRKRTGSRYIDWYIHDCVNEHNRSDTPY